MQPSDLWQAIGSPQVAELTALVSLTLPFLLQRHNPDPPPPPQKPNQKKWTFYFFDDTRCQVSSPFTSSSSRKFFQHLQQRDQHGAICL